MSQTANSRIWYRYVFTYADGRQETTFPYPSIRHLKLAFMVPANAATFKIEVCELTWRDYADQPDPANS